MKLEQQVTSLEISKRLKELGVKQESWIWWDTDDNKLIQTDDGTAPIFSTGDARRKGGGQWQTDMKRTISAFTVAELGEMLPKYCPEHKDKDLQVCHNFGDGWFVGYGDHRNFDGCHVESEATEADARGKMLIYLLENDLIKL